jgi:YesN/AraC family two-component response regulator
MHYYIKNMVCNRCILVVREIFEKLNHPPVNISLGEVETAVKLENDDLETLKQQLLSYGFELIEDTKSQLIEKIKTVIITLVHHNHDTIRTNSSDYIASQLNRDYNYLSSLFSEVEGTTIEKYIIHQKIERVKELLVYDELSLSEIADQMGYGNVSYLSSQFKKVTGLTPSHFKQIKENKRKPLNEV